MKTNYLSSDKDISDTNTLSALRTERNDSHEVKLLLCDVSENDRLDRWTFVHLRRRHLVALHKSKFLGDKSGLTE